MTPEALAVLRARLLALRADALRQLAEADHLDAGFLAIVGNAGAALLALEMPPADAQPAERVVVADDGFVIRLVSYTGAAALAEIQVDPARAHRLACELLAAASRRLFDFRRAHFAGPQTRARARDGAGR